MAQNPTNTPMMEQYLQIKEDYPDMILFFRMGDFYEMFFDDARVAAQALDIALTERQKGVPMAGVPFHAVDTYLNRLVQAGHKVAICDQLETKPPKGEKVVRREVVRVVTPGTHIHEGTFGHYLLSLYLTRQEAAAVAVDFATGDVLVYSADKNMAHGLVRDLLSYYGSAEFILGGKGDLTFLVELLHESGSLVNELEEWVYDRSHVEREVQQFYGVFSQDSVLDPYGHSLSSLYALGAALYYIRKTQKGVMSHLRFPRYIHQQDILRLDESAVRSLELVQNEQDGSVKGSLFAVLDQCATPMGKRRLRERLLQPFGRKEQMEHQLDCVQELVDGQSLRESLIESLKNIRDLAKLAGKISAGKAVPADLANLRSSVRAGLALLAQVSDHGGALHRFIALDAEPARQMAELLSWLESFVVEQPPLNFDGDYIAIGYDQEVDQLREIAGGGKKWLSSYQEQERQDSGISTLKVKYNRIFGYFIEISKAQAGQAPEHYERKQTLVNAERFTTASLKEFERKILTAGDQLTERQRWLFAQGLERIIKVLPALQSLSDSLGQLDLSVSLSRRAVAHAYVRPSLTQQPMMRIIQGRHPVVEEHMRLGEFVPNDIILDGDDRTIALITGPNMAGKSTYIRQVALLTLMAQMGSFVPAQEAVIGIVDQIFTRIGAGDNIARGQSTFLLEMQEAAAILHNYTPHSLLILDEIGRGTSTYDGMSIAWSFVEYLSSAKRKAPRTLFATHYHELTELARRRGVHNLNLLVEESDHGIRFLRRVVPGAADRSYGIHVAQLAGIPKSIIQRAYELLTHLEQGAGEDQPSLFEAVYKDEAEKGLDPPSKDTPSWSQTEGEGEAARALAREIAEIDVNQLSPMDALKLISEWQEEYASPGEG